MQHQGGTSQLHAGHTRWMDPTGLSSTFGQLVIAAGLIACIVVLIINLRRRR